MNHLKAINIKGFKKFQSLSLEFNEHMNILVGENEAGKSSILDAIRIVLNQQYRNADKAVLKDLFNMEMVKAFQASMICKLVYNRATVYYPLQFMNWSYSKGDTVAEACVILTNDFENMDKSNFTLQDISVSTRNKLYVAMTRSKGKLYLVKASVFKKFKESYRLKQ